MTTTDPFARLFDTKEGALAQVVRFNEYAARTVEKVARYQYEVAGDLLDAGIEQMQLFSKIEKPEEMLHAEIELTQALAKKMAERSEGFLKLAEESRKGFAELNKAAAAKPKAKAA